MILEHWLYHLIIFSVEYPFYQIMAFSKVKLITDLNTLVYQYTYGFNKPMTKPCDISKYPRFHFIKIIHYEGKVFLIR